MRSINAKQFKQFINDDPSWATKLKGPVEIRTYANMDNSGITHLSPFLLFSGRDNEGNVASFRGCSKLEKAEGNFDGFVDFGVSYEELEVNLESEGGNQDSLKDIETNEDRLEDKPEEIIDLPHANSVGIKKIGKLNILRPNNKGYAADFSGCIHLTTYTGKYPGHVDIGHNDLLRWTREMSGGAEREEITIKDLEIYGENNKGLSCTIHNSIIKELSGKFGSTIRLVGTHVKDIGDPTKDPTKDPKKEVNCLEIKPNATGAKIELKHNSFPSKIDVKCFAEDFPFQAHEILLPRASTKKEGDPLAELRDVLRIKKALLTKENPKNYNDPWHKQLKRSAVRTIAQCLQADDILKTQGYKAKSGTRLRKILKVSILMTTILISFSGQLGTEIAKKIQENIVVNPVAQNIETYASQRINENLLSKFIPTRLQKKTQEEIIEDLVDPQNSRTKKPNTKVENAQTLGLIIEDIEKEKEKKEIIQLTSTNQTSCNSPNCCHTKEKTILEGTKGFKGFGGFSQGGGISLASL